MSEPRLLSGDCRELMRDLADNSIDSIVTDPPYELGFMGKGWDRSGIANDPAIWAEALRVLKPGGHLVAFGGSRTYHRMVCAIEDAGFDVRDQIQWIYGSGFPKSRNIGDGWGTALKPAHEPIVVARKPLEGTVAANVAKWGTGALNIDGCRIEGDVPRTTQGQATSAGTIYGADQRTLREFEPHAAGRWPANLIHDGSDEVLDLFAAFGDKGGGHWHNQRGASAIFGKSSGGSAEIRYEGRGTAARFFYCAKASKADRGEGNGHPTVKPTALMRYLCRLVTPPGGTILDPFMGSGSTGRGAVLEGFRFIGIDITEDYVDIARKRIAAA